MTDIADFLDPTIAPSGTDCVECDRDRTWWVHLRRCAKCGHIGCCDDSLNKHASAHARTTGHRIIQSFEPGEEWFWDYGTDQFADGGPALAAPTSHPLSQSIPGPADRVPRNWQRLLDA